LHANLSQASAIVYGGMARFGGGAVLAGLMLGAIAVFIIDRNFRSATVYAVAAAVLAFFGLIHGTEIGIGVNLDIVIGYLLMAGLTGYLALRAPAPVEAEAEAEVNEPAAVPASAEPATP
jgi:AGZA family xanthine/uracil permease-like MFS transporter